MAPDDDQLDRIFMALSDRTRRAILDRLREGPLSAGALAEGSLLTQPTVSKHLKVLESAGLIERKRDGNRVFSTLNPDPLVRAAVYVSRFEQVVDARLERLAAIVEERSDQEEQQ